MITVPTPQSRCRFGIRVADITPPVGIYHRMWGAADHDRSEGVHRPLTATAMYFSKLQGTVSSDDQQILIALDHCLLGVDEVQRIIERITRATKLPAAAIMLTFSHTHAAGLLNLDRRDLPGGELIEDYLSDLADTVADCVKQAVSEACVADVVYGTGSCRLAAHRDLFDADQDEFVCGFNPTGDADDHVVVARVTDEHGRVLAGLVNYACHPTTLAWQNRLISPDYPGAMRELVEAAIGAPCVFLQGASGELGPVEGFVGDTSVADRNGRQLGYASLGIWESLPPANTQFSYSGKVVSGASIGTWERRKIEGDREARIAAWQCERKSIALPYRADLPRRQDVEARFAEAIRAESEARQQDDLESAQQFRALAEREKRMLGRLRGLPEDSAFPFQSAICRMGDAIWVVVQGEPYSLLQRQLRENFPSHPIVVATIGNGWGPSYLPEEHIYGQGIYQESIAALAPGSLETLIDELSRRIARMIE